MFSRVFVVRVKLWDNEEVYLFCILACHQGCCPEDLNLGMWGKITVIASNSEWL